MNTPRPKGIVYANSYWRQFSRLGGDSEHDDIQTRWQKENYNIDDDDMYECMYDHE